MSGMRYASKRLVGRTDRLEDTDWRQESYSAKNAGFIVGRRYCETGQLYRSPHEETSGYVKLNPYVLC